MSCLNKHDEAPRRPAAAHTHQECLIANCALGIERTGDTWPNHVGKLPEIRHGALHDFNLALVFILKEKLPHSFRANKWPRKLMQAKKAQHSTRCDFGCFGYEGENL